jgi:hypothetical protein
MPVLVLRATRPMHPQLGGHVIDPELFERFKAEMPYAETLDVPANHYSILADAGALEAIAGFVRR